VPVMKRRSSIRRTDVRMLATSFMQSLGLPFRQAGGAQTTLAS
jgi:hypothetical protein